MSCHLNDRSLCRSAVPARRARPGLLLLCLILATLILPCRPALSQDTAAQPGADQLSETMKAEIASFALEAKLESNTDVGKESIAALISELNESSTFDGDTRLPVVARITLSYRGGETDVAGLEASPSLSPWWGDRAIQRVASGSRAPTASGSASTATGSRRRLPADARSARG